MTWIHILRQDVAPVLGAYLVFLAFLATYRRSPRAGRGPGGQDQGKAAASRREMVGYLASTVAGGYAVFLAIVVRFYFVLGNEEGSLIIEAVTGGSLLVLVVVVPAFLLLSWIDHRFRSRKAGSPTRAAGTVAAGGPSGLPAERPGRSSGRGPP
jgi:UDP-N-acetylmuramyl pentapeptide phosphotransferase/UDP-N-acetylglucosamine-1-phosphate transferase